CPCIFSELESIRDLAIISEEGEEFAKIAFFDQMFDSITNRIIIKNKALNIKRDGIYDDSAVNDRIVNMVFDRYRDTIPAIDISDEESFHMLCHEMTCYVLQVGNEQTLYAPHYDV